MHRSLNSTELLSKTYSRMKMGASGLKMSTSVLQSNNKMSTSVLQSNKMSPNIPKSRSPNIPKSRSPRNRSKPVSRPQSSHHQSKVLLKEPAMITQLHETLIAKNKKLNIMIKNVYSFAICLEDIDWIIKEAETIIRDYIHSIQGKGRTPHRIQIDNIHNELLKLIQRFSGMEKQDIRKLGPQISKKNILSENINMMNFQHPDTICSFKCTDMDFNQNNQEDTIPADFSKIKLPSVIKQSASMENINSSRYEHEVKTKQFQATIEILKYEIESEKASKDQIKNRYEQEIENLNKKIQRSVLEWQSYKNYAGATIRKCKQYLNNLGKEDPEEIERLLDDLFTWENTIDGNILDDGNEAALSCRKRQILDELSSLEWKVKQNRAEVEKLQGYKTKASSKFNTGRSKSGEVRDESYQQYVKMLYVQASTIEHLI